MRFLPMLAFSLLAAASLAGCNDNNDDGNTQSPETPAIDFAPIVTPVVHRSDGRTLAISDYPGEMPVLEERYVGDRGAGEPTIAVDRDGVAIYPSIEFDINAFATSLPSTRVMRSTDGGLTWTDASPALGGRRTSPASLDPYVYADPVTGRMFSLDLNLAAGGFLSWTDDGAQTWTNNPACCGVPVDDHQTIFSGPATVLVANPVLYPGRVVYYCVNQVADSICTHSLDGGLTWSAGVSAYPGVEATENQPSVCGGLHGHGHASEATGTVFLPKGHCGRAEVARSTDNGMTWSQVVVDTEFGIDGHEAIVSTDRVGNVYYFFLDGNALPRLSVSTDDGRTWSSPLNVTAPGVTTAKFPSIVAGEEGRVAFLYVGSASPVGAHMYEDGNESYMENSTWNAYVGFSLDALSADPIFATVTAHAAEDPLHRGGCAGRCQVVNGGMYDFLDIDVNPLTGQVWVAMVDNCNNDTPYHSEPCSGPHGTFQSYRRARAAVGVQVGGTPLGTRLP